MSATVDQTAGEPQAALAPLVALPLAAPASAPALTLLGDPDAAICIDDVCEIPAR